MLSAAVTLAAQAAAAVQYDEDYEDDEEDADDSGGTAALRAQRDRLLKPNESSGSAFVVCQVSTHPLAPKPKPVSRRRYRVCDSDHE